MLLMNRIGLIVGLLAMLLPAVARCDGNEEFFKALGRTDCQVVPLWSDRIGPGESKPQFQDGTITTPDGSLVFRPVVQAELIVIPPPKGTRTTGVAVMFCPGGGYGALETQSIQQGSKWLNEMGVTAVLLKYRIPRRSGEHPAHYLPLMDAQRGMGLLRSRAKDWQLDPQKIGVIGFSAGGHLAAMLSNHHDKRSYEVIDELDRAACRPDFCLLMYPAYLTNPTLELQPDPALQQELMSPEKTPPTLISVVRPDKFAVGCVSYFKALRKAKVPAELHMYSSGWHGGCFDRYPLLGWGYESARFLRDHKFLDDEAVNASTRWLKAAEADVKASGKNLHIDTVGAAKALPKFDAAAVVPHPSDALDASQLNPGDAELRKLVGPEAAILPVWPAGKRPTDVLVEKGPIAETTPTLPSEKEFLRIGTVTTPTLTVMRPAQPDGRAILICPGGAYSRLAIQHEGTDIGRWLNQQGITAFLLKYRVPKRDGVSVALQDAQRSLSLIRSRAAEFGVDPNWIGIIGFSAGGHLAAEMCHKYRERSYEPIDTHDRATCRPNFALLIYPAYLAIKDGQLAEAFNQPQRNWTPPTFVAFAINDNLIEGAFPYVLKLREARIPTAFHVYESGGHGKGLRADGYPFTRWSFAAERWLSDLLSVEEATSSE